MPKHTLGPWGLSCALSSDSYSIRYLTGPDGEMIATIRSGYKHIGPNDFDQETALANASLIAAALDMLEALKLAEERIEISNCEGEEDEFLAVIRAAIAKAEGR